MRCNWRYGFEVRLHAGQKFGEYIIYYRLTTPGVMRFHTNNAQADAGRQLQWFVARGVDVKIIHNR